MGCIKNDRIFATNGATAEFKTSHAGLQKVCIDSAECNFFEQVALGGGKHLADCIECNILSLVI
jgi:hypothetical protein